jgi:hypothetical protein
MFSMRSVVRFHEEPAGRYLAKWELPRAEIFRRGLQTSGLPGWVGARADRRLPLVPSGLGFFVDSLVYFVGLSGILFLWRLCKG